ncbi:hypothetical protein ABH922_005474 [Rhodococcus sp. 27YEA15]
MPINIRASCPDMHFEDPLAVRVLAGVGLVRPADLPGGRVRG